MNVKTQKNIYFLISCLLLTACSGGFSNNEKHARTYETRHPITLTKKQNSIEIPINVIDVSFDTRAEAKIKSFLYEYDTQNDSNLVITVPETGLKVSSARIAVKNILSLAQEVGIKRNNIRVGTYKPLNDTIGGIRMNFEAVVAEAPDCSNRWSENLSDTYNNEIPKGHGCSAQKNLAAMIANPKDLAKMRPMGSGNAARRIDTFDKYIAGQATGAARGSEETATATAQ
jgi:pilus assembly protein CpaD